MHIPAITVLILTVWLSASPAVSQSIGSGNPGLKVVTNKLGAVAVYQDEPQTLGAGGMGGWKNRQINVIVDDGYNFDKSFLEISDQLFPFDSDSAFTCKGGSWTSDFSRWDYSRRKYFGYRLLDGRLTIFNDVQKQASEKYQLSPGEEFLGCIDQRIFFWKGFNPSSVYWREQGTSRIYRLDLPKGIIDLLGATRGIKKDIAFLTFRKSHGFFHYSPYTFEPIEFNLSKSVPCAP